jgi:hypothetical protein
LCDEAGLIDTDAGDGQQGGDGDGFPEGGHGDKAGNFDRGGDARGGA